MGRALVILVTAFVAVCAALPVALNEYRPPHEPGAFTTMSLTQDGCTWRMNSQDPVAHVVGGDLCPEDGDVVLTIHP